MERNSSSSHLSGTNVGQQSEHNPTTNARTIKQRFNDIGINDIKENDFDIMPPDIQNEVIEAFEEMYTKFPSVISKITKVDVVDYLQEGVVADTLPILSNNKVEIIIRLNKNHFKDPNFEKINLYNAKSTNFLAVGRFKGTIIHEIGHVLQYYMDANWAGLQLGGAIDDVQKANLLVFFWNTRLNAMFICEDVIKRLKILDILECVYGERNYKKCFDKACIDVLLNLLNPTKIFSDYIVDEYGQAADKNNLEEIFNKAIQKMKTSGDFKRIFIRAALSEYGASTDGECLAEAVSEYYNNPTSARRFSCEIVKEFINKYPQVLPPHP